MTTTQESLGKSAVALVDGSHYSASVCDYAAWLCSKTQGTVKLLHVLGRRENQTPLDPSGTIGLGARSALLAELAALDAERAKLAQAKGRAILEDATNLLQAGGVTQVSSLMRQGDLLEELQTAAADADLIFMGKRGEAADFAKMHIGSNLERVLRSIHKPVFVASRAFKPVKRAMLAFDGGPSTLKAVQTMAQSPIFDDLELHLCMAGRAPAKAALTLEEAADILREAGRQVTSHQQEGAAAEVIAGQVKTLNIDLLVMGAYGHSRMRTMIIGSTTTEMIQSCLVPILLMR